MMALSTLLVDSVSPVVSAMLLGFGLGMVTPEFLMMFVRLSAHCQRCTANMTHFLAWEAGLTSGIALACRINNLLPHDELMAIGKISTVGALAFFLLFTVPYFKKNSLE
jgi:hypothetical protein